MAPLSLPIPMLFLLRQTVSASTDNPAIVVVIKHGVIQVSKASATSNGSLMCTLARIAF